MNIQKKAVLEKLLALIDQIYTASDGYTEQPEDNQPWYDRGYADGMVQALNELGYAERVAKRADNHDTIAQHRWMPWGKAYQHGKETGYREVNEVLK